MSEGIYPVLTPEAIRELVMVSTNPFVRMGLPDELSEDFLIGLRLGVQFLCLSVT